MECISYILRPKNRYKSVAFWTFWYFIIFGKNQVTRRLQCMTGISRHTPKMYYNANDTFLSSSVDEHRHESIPTYNMSVQALSWTIAFFHGQSSFSHMKVNLWHLFHSICLCDELTEKAENFYYRFERFLSPLDTKAKEIGLLTLQNEQSVTLIVRGAFINIYFWQKNRLLNWRSNLI